MFLNRKYHVLKKMNYFSDQRGIFERYILEYEGWSKHIQKTKETIEKNATLKKNNSCAILGSGWLIDVPIDFLSKYFKKVYLFDIIHPVQVKHKIKNYNNVELVEIDITGGAIQEFYDSVQMFKHYKKRKELSEIVMKGFSFPLEFDYVVSVNILSQLDQMLSEYLKKYNLYSKEELIVIKKMIQQKHLDTLPKEKSCLITDYYEYVYDDNNNLEIKNNIIYIELPFSKLIDKWTWEFDHHNYYPGKNIVFEVLAFNL